METHSFKVSSIEGTRLLKGQNFIKCSITMGIAPYFPYSTQLRALYNAGIYKSENHWGTLMICLPLKQNYIYFQIKDN
jgi:hypothetical protein